MPIYGYKCPNEHEFDILCKYHEEEQDCPECGQPAERQLSSPNFNMKQGPYDSFL